jgi:hypothetical protein
MIATLLLAVAIGGPQTPQAGALAFLRPTPDRAQAVVRVVVQTPRYALVQYSHAKIEGWASAGQILVERFAFGWQAIDISTIGAITTCSVGAHGLPQQDYSRLRGALSATRKDCPTGIDADQRDVGTAADVSAVRALMISSSEIVPFVRVVENYAYVPWFGAGGGENFYKKTASEWKKIGGGGGAYQSSELQKLYGVPLSIARALLGR